MENKFLDKITRTFSVEMPGGEDMEDYLDQILPIIRQWGEDLNEEEFYLEKPWMEIRDSVNFHDAILYFFNPGGELIISVNGDIRGGSWRYLESSNKLILQTGKNSELYELAYLDNYFFILSKHGDQRSLNRESYFVLAYEPIAQRMEWRDAMEFLFNQYRSNNNLYITIAVLFLVLVGIFILFSVF